MIKYEICNFFRNNWTTNDVLYPIHSAIPGYVRILVSRLVPNQLISAVIVTIKSLSQDFHRDMNTPPAIFHNGLKIKDPKSCMLRCYMAKINEPVFSFRFSRQILLPTWEISEFNIWFVRGKINECMVIAFIFYACLALGPHAYNGLAK